jgi:hypothetical protein
MLKKRVERKIQRFPAQLALRELNGQPAGGAHLVDISSVGAQVETPRVFPMNAPLEFVVHFPGMNGDARLSGLTRWIKPIIGRPGWFRLGLKFFQPYWEIDHLARKGILGGDGP